MVEHKISTEINTAGTRLSCVQPLVKHKISTEINHLIGRYLDANKKINNYFDVSIEKRIWALLIENYHTTMSIKMIQRVDDSSKNSNSINRVYAQKKKFLEELYERSQILPKLEKVFLLFLMLLPKLKAVKKLRRFFLESWDGVGGRGGKCGAGGKCAVGAMGEVLEHHDAHVQ